MEKQRPITFAELLAREFPPDNYIIDEGILGKNGILWIAGPPKIRKSFTALTMMVDLVTGRNLFGAQRAYGNGFKPAFKISAPQRVLFLEQEIGLFDVRNRMIPAYESLNDTEKELVSKNLLLVSQDHTMRLDKAEGAIRLGELIREAKPDVVVFDPLAKFHNADENDAQEMGNIMGNIAMLRNTFEFATVIIHHEGKNNDGKEGPDRMRGSSVMFADGDSFLMLKGINGNAGLVRIDFTIRRGKEITPIMIQMGGNNLFKFHKWLGGRKAENG